MPGIIANTLNNGQTAYGAETERVDPSLQTVDQPTQTVAGQLHSILANDSPYIRQARSGALDTANGRGLINSSIAAGAGESAAIGAALPIASQDASTYTHVADTNQAAKNAAATFNAGSTNTANLNTANAGNASQMLTQQTGAQKELAAQSGEISSRLSAQSAGQQEALQAQSGQIQTALQQLRGDQAQNLQNVQSQYQSLIQTNASAASEFNATQNLMAQVLSDTNTTPEQKATTIDSLTAMLHSSLTVLGHIANLDLAGLLNFGNGANVAPA